VIKTQEMIDRDSNVDGKDMLRSASRRKSDSFVKLENHAHFVFCFV
jgi:hypothetical protein